MTISTFSRVQSQKFRIINPSGKKFEIVLPDPQNPSGKRFEIVPKKFEILLPDPPTSPPSRFEIKSTIQPTPEQIEANKRGLVGRYEAGERSPLIEQDTEFWVALLGVEGVNGEIIRERVVEGSHLEAVRKAFKSFTGKELIVYPNMTKYELASWCSQFQQTGFPNIGGHEYVIMGHGIGENGRGDWQFIGSSGVRVIDFIKQNIPNGKSVLAFVCQDGNRCRMFPRESLIISLDSRGTDYREIRC